MTALPERRRRSTLVALTCGLVVLATMPVFGVAAWRAIRDSTAAQNVGVIETLAIPSTPAALLAAVDESGEVASLTVIALRPQGAGGTIVSVPVGTRSDAAVDSVRRVADAYTIGGEEALVQDMQSLMGVTFSVAAVVDEAELADLLSNLGDVTVELPDDLRDSAAGDDAATTDIVVPAGLSVLTPDLVAAALTARDVGAPEVERLADVKAIWEAVSAQIGEGVGAGASTDDPTTMDDVVARLVAGPVSVWQIGASSVPAGEANPEGLDLYSVRRGEIVLLMASVAPSAVSPTLSGASVQIDSAYGDSDLSLAAIELFAYFNTNVLLVREVEGPPPARTVVRYADVDADVGDFDFLRKIIGDFDLERVDSRVEGIDLQITLGDTFTQFLDTIEFDPSVTTAPPDDTTDTTGTTDTTDTAAPTSSTDPASVDATTPSGSVPAG